jgi:Lon protease-like protein
MQVGMAQPPLIELPLFPISSVLFPYVPMRLHVFEERYRQLVHDCLREDRPLGIVLIRSGSEVGGPADPHLVGTMVQILKVDTYDDGTMDIQVHGSSRFRIRRLDESKPYLVGFVEHVEEIELEDTPRADALIGRAREDFQAWVKMKLARRDMEVRVRLPDEPVQLSFAIANTLPISNLDKQRMLEMTDTLDRLAGLIPLIDEQLVESTEPAAVRVQPSDLEEWVFRN